MFARDQTCFKRYTTALTWNDAYRACQNAIGGGRLAVVSDSGTHHFLTRLIPTNTYIGLYRSGNWFKWVDGSALTYSFWSSGEPNNHGGKENVVEMWSSGKWNDITSSSKRHYMCEYSLRP